MVAEAARPLERREVEQLVREVLRERLRSRNTPPPAVERSATIRTAGPPNPLVVNVSGSLTIGLIAGWFALRSQAGQTLRLFLTTGVLGGYTTFSAFALDTALLWERGQVWGCAFYIASSVLLSLAGVFLGLAIIRQLPS